MLGQAVELGPGLAVVAADKQPRFLDAGVPGAGLRGMSRHDLPDVLQLETGLGGVGGARLDLLPGFAEVGRLPDGGAVDIAAGAGEDAVALRVAAQAVDLPAREVRAGHGPLFPALVAVIEEGALGRADEERERAGGGGFFPGHIFGGGCRDR
jgi:hypothetical protein